VGFGETVGGPAFRAFCGGWGCSPVTRHYLTGEEGVVEIASRWTAQRRERMGNYLTIRGRGSA